MKLDYDDAPAAAPRTSVRAVCCGSAGIASILLAVMSAGILYLGVPERFQPFFWLCKHFRWRPGDADFGGFVLGLLEVGVVLLLIGNPTFWFTRFNRAPDDVQPAKDQSSAEPGNRDAH